MKSLVTALAATHSPDELNLVLVDFKGGATFLGCESLPHTSAVITNLEDESILVERMYDALSGELNRRQEVLRRAGNFANVTDYAIARAQGRTDLEALPSLVIIVDEFSELLGQHPHFADLFVAIGRLGRSLGVHLLLASQRLEEGKLRGLDSHLSYRIGLKTFSAAESRQVLGVPDAYELPQQPGNGYIKASSPELVRFRAAYVSGPLVRRQAALPASEVPSVGLFHGWEVPELAPEEVLIDDSTTVLDAVVAASRDTAAARGEVAHQVWLPPLPDAVDISAVIQPAQPLSVAIGLVDDPYNQRQDPLVVDFTAAGGHLAIAGAAQSGKSMALRTIITTLAANHTTAEMAFYIIDAGSGGFADLEVLPHIAGTATRAQEEKLRRIIDEVTGFIDDPARACGRQIFLVIDGWHAVVANDSKLQDLRDPLARIASEGPAAGVHLVISTQRWSAIRTNVRDLFGTRLELHLGDAADSLVDRKRQQKVPARAGRGLAPDGRHMLIAVTNAQNIAHIARQSADQEKVPQVKVLPDHIALQDLAAGRDSGIIPFGIGGPQLNTLFLDNAHLIAVGTSGSGKSTVLSTLIKGICDLPRENARLVILDPRRAHLSVSTSEMVASYAASPDAVIETIKATVATLRSRMPGSQVTAEEQAARSWWQGPDIYVVIDDAELVSDDALRPLLPLFAHARDIGLHVVVARTFSGTARALYSGLLAALRDVHPHVLLFDATKDEGALFGVKPGPQPPGRAIFVRGGTTLGTVQVATPDAKENLA